jgi:hypothetical protein
MNKIGDCHSPILVSYASFLAAAACSQGATPDHGFPIKSILRPENQKAEASPGSPIPPCQCRSGFRLTITDHPDCMGEPPTPGHFLAHFTHCFGVLY